MSPEDRADILAKLEACRQDLVAALAGMSDCDAAAKPPEGGWSALEIVEHLTRVERNLLRQIQAGEPAAAAAAVGREARMYELARLRGRKVNAPETAHPIVAYSTVTEALARFDAARAETLAYVEACDRDLRGYTMQHPVIGPVTCWECLHLIAAHPSRHAQQIREGRAAR